MFIFEDMGFEFVDIEILFKFVSCGLIWIYDEMWDILVINGIFWLGIYFCFGIISIWEKVWWVKQFNEIFFNELIWCDFYV